MCANPTFEQMAQHWFYSFGTNPSAESLFDHVLVFEFQVGDLKNIWWIDSGCSRHMTGDQMFVWSFPRVRCFMLFFLSLRVWSVVSWLVLRVSCGSGIGSWVT
jgi:hypothetical protein